MYPNDRMPLIHVISILRWCLNVCFYIELEGITRVSFQKLQNVKWRLIDFLVLTRLTACRQNMNALESTYARMYRTSQLVHVAITSPE